MGQSPPPGGGSRGEKVLGCANGGRASGSENRRRRLLIGFGSAFKASRVVELEKQVQQLTQDNADLRGQLATAAVPMTPAPGVVGLPAKP
jgi:hypothetical protein